MTVGQTQRSGFQAGARKTFNVAPAALWSMLVGQAGQQALGEREPLSSTSVGVTTFVAGSHYRRRRNDGVLQVRVVPAAGGRATLALHVEHLPDEAGRVAALARFANTLEQFAHLLA